MNGLKGLHMSDGQSTSVHHWKPGEPVLYESMIVGSRYDNR